jgi:hypothetical protein
VNAAAATASDDVRRQEIIVTGSNIRGEEPAGSHVRTIRKAEMDRNGYTTVAQALQALPGNFGGVATEQSSLSYVDRTASNATASTGINLRGLALARRWFWSTGIALPEPEIWETSLISPTFPPALSTVLKC